MLSPEIYEARLGNITASGAHRIMAGWDTPKPTAAFPPEIYDWIAEHEVKPLVGALKAELSCEISSKFIEAAWKAYRFDTPSQGLLTYAEDLACEELFDYDPSVFDGSNNPHMINGNERELEAMNLLRERTGLNFAKTGDDQIHVCVDGIGATPDGIVYDDLDLIRTGCEVKCRSPLHHARQLLITDNDSLKQLDFDRYCQIQVGCFVTGVTQWYSANYNPYAKDKAHKLHYCIIERDDELLSIFKQRAAQVFSHKQAFMVALNSQPSKVAA